MVQREFAHDNNPKAAHGVVRTLLDTFMEGSLGMKRTDAGVAERFLAHRSPTTSASSDRGRVNAWPRSSRQNVGLLPGSGGDYYQRLETADDGARQRCSSA